MKKIRIIPLALALVMALPLLLTACSKEEPEPSPPIDAGILPPSSSGGGLMIIPVPTFSLDEEVPDAPTEPAEVVGPEESGNLAEPLTSQAPVESPAPAESQAPVESQPIQTPQPEATPEPTVENVPGASAPTLTAAQVYNKVASAATDTYMVDTSYVLDAFYPGLSEADFEDFVLYMPDASEKVEEIFIAKVVSGRMEAVRTACQSRQQAMKEDAAFYAATGDYVDDYRLVVSGDWILFLVAENATAGETAFNDYTK